MTFFKLSNTIKNKIYNWFNPVTYLSLSQTTTWISYSICLFFTVQLFEVIVRFVDIVGIVDHLCLNFKYLGSLPVFSGVHVARSLVFCVKFCFLIVPLCCLVIRFTDYDYPFGIFKLFLCARG
jgi:hypothetical protein